jgi:hypothetical protein
MLKHLLCYPAMILELLSRPTRNLLCSLHRCSASSNTNDDRSFFSLQRRPQQDIFIVQSSFIRASQGKASEVLLFFQTRYQNP